MKKILLVGCGHMGSTLLDAWQKEKKYNISVIDPKTYQTLKKKYLKRKIEIFKSINQIKNINHFNVIIFAIKPQVAEEVVKQFQSIQNKGVIIISIVAGKKINFFNKLFNKPHQIIRTMPNMGSFVNKGMTCLVSNNLTSNSNLKLASNLFKSVGKIIWSKKESDIDKVTAISGSGPAYFFLFVEHLISEATKLGLKKNVAEKLVYQTAFGSIKLLEISNKNATELRKSIAVKGGTTEAAIIAFEKQSRFQQIIKKALKASYNRSKDLGNN